jgi:hypothetical protein
VKFSDFMGKLNTTSYRIFASVNVFCSESLAVTFAILLGWVPTELQITVLKINGIALLIAMGIDLTQYAWKRHTDKDYQAAKNQAQVQVQADVAQVDAGGAAPGAPAVQVTGENPGPAFPGVTAPAAVSPASPLPPFTYTGREPEPVPGQGD